MLAFAHDLDAIPPPPAAWPDDLRFAPRDPEPKAPARERIVAIVFVVVAHALLAWFLEEQSHAHALAADRDSILVSFIRTLPATVIHPPALPARVPPRVAPDHARPSLPRPRAATEAAEANAHAPPAAPATALSLYTTDGRLRLPEGLLQEIDRTSGDARQFDFQLPDLEAAGAFLRHPPALAYEPTRFERYWRPNENLLDTLLRKAVESTTKEVKIRIPGDPSHHIVCTVSLLAAGGACGIRRNGEDGDLRPGEDDPATLTAEEAARCQAWWERIVGAGTQDEWRQTRRLYEAQCRKPLAAAPVVAKEPAPAQ
jgi:hypothetical protein